MSAVTPMDKAALLALAERVEGMAYFACPMCGDTDFDVPGFSQHVFKWCVVDRAASMAKNNAEVARNLRALAQGPSHE